MGKRRLANEEKEIRKLKKAMKKKEKLEKKLKRKEKKRRIMAGSDSDFSEGDMLASLDLLKAKQEQLASGAGALDSSDEELYSFLEEKCPKSPSPVSKKKSSVNGRDSGKESKQTRQRVVSGEREGGGGGKEKKRRNSGESGLRARLGRKMEQSKGDKRLEDREEGELDLETDNVSADRDILDKMKRKNERRLRRIKEVEQDKLMFA